jgi:alkylation response protein AidB-like acyl-CoA dehydrogenase
MELIIWNQEESRYDLPVGPFAIGLGMCGPTMIAYATEAQKRAHLPRMASGEDIWCQLFSEPAGGSDLAALRTKAVRDGDDWVVNGQKIWTSGAHYSDWGILVTRTDPNVPKHKGLTFFFLNMRSPGIEVKPIKQISGGANFNEVYFTDVRIPDAQRLGAVGQGWQVSITTLMNERLAVGNAGGADVDEIMALARSVKIDGKPALRNAAVREKIADWYCQSSGLRFTNYRTISALSRGQTPGPENSITKVVSAVKQQEIGSFGLDLMDMGGILMDPRKVPAELAFQMNFLGAPGYRIAGGTDEILRNIIAERVLGLPPDARADKGLAFKDVPTGPPKA